MVDWLDTSIQSSIAKVNGSKNCPNCGAPIETERCPYCGSLFVDFACMSTDEPFFMKIKKGNEVFIVKVRMMNVDIAQNYPTTLYYDNNPYITLHPPRELTANFLIID